MSQHTHLIGIGLHSRLEVLPIGGAHFLQADDLKRRLAVALPKQRLHLEQRIAGMELDRRIRAGQPNVGEKRAEPGFRLDDTLEMLVALGSRNIGGTPGEQCPPGAVRAR
jgi:hypothetical protein